MISRRGFIGGLITALATPAIVKFDSIMPVRSLPILYTPVKSNSLLIYQNGWIRDHMLDSFRYSISHFKSMIEHDLLYGYHYDQPLLDAPLVLKSDDYNPYQLIDEASDMPKDIKLTSKG